MKFSEFNQLQENSLYTDAAGKAALAGDKERLMDSLMFNFFGFLGLYNLSDSRGYMKTYETTEGKLFISNIGDTNHDVSLSVKMAYDAGLMTQSVVNKMTRLLVLIKEKKVKGKDIDASQIRSFLDEIHYSTHKPSTKVFTVMQSFHNNVLDLPNLARELYLLSKMREYMGITAEFRGLVMKGQYNDFFSKMKPAAAATTTSATPAAGAPATPTATQAAPKQAATVAAPKPPAPPPQVPTKQGQVDDFFDAIFDAKDQTQFNDAFNAYGVTKSGVDFNKFDVWFAKSKEEKDLPVLLLKSPFCKWLEQVPGKGKKKAYHILNQLIVEHIKRYAKAKDIKGFIESVKGFDYKELQSIINASNNNNWKVFNESFTILGAAFVTDIIAHVADVSDASLAALKAKWEPYRNFVSGVNSTSNIRDPSVYKDGFSKTAAYICLLNAFVYNVFTASDSPSYDYQVTVHKWFEKAFGKDCMVDPKSAYFKIKKSAFDAASEENQRAFQMLVDKKYNGADVIDMSSDGKVWARHWMTQLTDSYYVAKYIDNYTQVDTSKLTADDIAQATEEIAKSPKFMEHIGALSGAPADNLSAAGEAYFNAACKVVVNIMEMGKVDSSAMLLRYAAKNQFAFDRVTKYLESSNLLGEVKFALASILDSYSSNNNADLEKELCKWYVGLVKSGKATMSEDLLVMLVRKFDDIEFIRPADAVSAEKIFMTLKSYTNAQAYLRWMVAQEPELRAKIVEFNEKIDYRIARGALVDAKFSVKYLEDEFITDAIIDNFKAQWLKIPASQLESIDAYSFSQKLTNAYRETIANALDTPGYESFVFKALSVSTPDKVSAYLDKMSVPQMVDFLANQKTSAREVTQFVESMASNEDLAKNMSTSAVTKFSQALAQSFEKNKKKFEKSYRDSATKDYCEFLGLMKEKGRDRDLEVIYGNLKGEFKKSIVDYFVGYSFVDAASEAIFSDKTAIKPYQKLDHRRMVQVLRYNNVEPPASGVRDAPTFSSLMAKANMARGVVTEQKVEEVKQVDPSALERKSVEYDVYNKYRHGNIAIRFIREFTVDLPNQKTGQDEFLKYMPNTERIDPAFHGTGSIAASMILRYGFAVIKSGDSSVVGRMLGDGIYFSTVLDKVSQYTSDAGYTRGIGTKGYIFQMTALLGERNKDYRSAGLGGDSIRSPEWCVFDANKQLRIYKAFEVEIISKNAMDRLKAKHRINEDTAVKMISFKEFLREANTPGKQTTTYTFVDGMIPVNETDMVDFEQFNPSQYGNHVWIEPSQSGPMVVIEHDGEESEAFCVRFTGSFMSKTDDLQKFLGLLMQK